jgi:hypothetical protein
MNTSYLVNYYTSLLIKSVLSNASSFLLALAVNGKIFWFEDLASDWKFVAEFSVTRLIDYGGHVLI